ncbi:MAG: D-inositol-3-phosphate glycosyltransferase [Frankia sp.]|nr:D-inositol-3-phosphate glycosyltransferase [Frankia sp.]
MAVHSGPRQLRGPRRVATISVHTSPLDQPGTGDAGGMNVYIVEVARRLAALGIEVDIFTRATGGASPLVVELAPGVTVRHVHAGPLEGLAKDDLAAQLCAFTSGVLRAEAMREPGWYDLVHSHYWLSGQVAWLAAERWGVPMVHSSHTLAKVKNAALADGDAPEPAARAIGEAQVVDAADRLVASTDEEAHQLVELYDADPARIVTIAPGVDLRRFTPGDTAAARARLGLRPGDVFLLFVGRLQPLKAPDVVLRAAASLLAAQPELRDRLVVGVVGGPSGTGHDEPARLRRLANELGLRDRVRWADPVPLVELPDWYRAAHVVVVPSHSESFGLVALEAQACGTPVVAASVGGLRTAVRDGVSGVLVSGHNPEDYADVLGRLVAEPARHAALSMGAVAHAADFDWSKTAGRLVQTYQDAMAAQTRRDTIAAGQ